MAIAEASETRSKSLIWDDVVHYTERKRVSIILNPREFDEKIFDKFGLG